MYTVFWSTWNAFTDGGSTDRWERCETREEVAELLVRENLINDSDVLIFGPEAEDYLLCPEEIID